MNADAREPSPPSPAPPRHTTGPLPRYRFVPGRSPHPRRDRAGHSWGLPEPRLTAIDPDRWATCSLYLRGVDLFNYAYWWESHEAFEALWRAAPAGSPIAELLQALIQLAAAELKRFSGMPDAARALTVRALERLARVPSPCLGIEVRALETEAARRDAGARSDPLLLVLAAGRGAEPHRD